VCGCVWLCVVGNGSVLSINPVTVSSAATYTCAAYNNFTEGNASVQLIVHCECHVMCDVILCDRVEIITVSVHMFDILRS